ncbi:hypothetical protein HAV22_03310 [Massilia sp. TW-1]|uniref:Uncharacterized protein n=1 Tax=Telluria antibiotica TaxID=2717319 RepID=A0ABX0P623_9BURK|nr:hypothetical protein [Telluria antibiotica]NIA52685.1 hypothetical protein [Telluria antibiotica]
MTLYYTKPGPAYVSEEMAKAQQRIERAEQGNFLRFLKNAEIAALEECWNFELYNAVCQVAAVYPNDSPVVSTLRRGRLLDVMLSHNGRGRVFATLSEDEAIAVGNEFVNLLMARMGRAEMVDLIGAPDAGIDRH